MLMQYDSVSGKFIFMFRWLIERSPVIEASVFKNAEMIIDNGWWAGFICTKEEYMEFVEMRLLSAGLLGKPTMSIQAELMAFNEFAKRVQ